ncbi:myosin-2 heavy chain-like [Engraulis encrasicolus]|uniref:myosin-2 heavy chain-like n=1 Tax=Engraulis encrasicolus TaxID=184585 RepID=UPI002FD6C13E
MNQEKTETTEKYLQRISDLEKQLEELLGLVEGKTSENEALVVQIMVLKATETSLTKQIESVKHQHDETAKDFKKELEKKVRELELETTRCNRQAERIDSLILEISEYEANVTHFKKVNQQKHAELEQKLLRITQQLQDTIAQLKIVEGEKAEQVLKVIEIQTEMVTIVNKGITEKESLQAEIEALKRRVQTCSEEKATLTVDIKEMKINERKIMEQCSLLNDTYWETQREFDAIITKVDENSRLVLRMNLLISEIEKLQRDLPGKTGDSRELEYELESKIEELEKLEKQLGLRNRMDSKKITTIMTTIINNGKIAMAQTNEQYLAQIDALEKELDEMISMVKGEEAEKIKLMMKVLALESDIASLERRIEKTKQEATYKIKEIERQLLQKYMEINALKVQDKTHSAKIEELEAEARKLELDLSKAKQTANDQLEELERRLELKKEELQRQSDKMVGLDKENGELVLKLIIMENKMKDVILNIETLENTSAGKIKDLKEKIQVMTVENDELKIRITDLEKSKQEVIDSCTTVKEQYTDLQIKVEEDLKKMQDIPGLILKITNLNREIDALNKAIASKTGDETELKKELEQKLKELAQIEGALGGKSPAAKQIIEVIAILRQKGNVIADNTEEYLARITELENELDEKIDALQDKEGERIKAVLKMLEHEDEISQLKNVLAKAKADAAQKIAAIETKLNHKRIEIDRLKAEDCGKGQKVQQIQALEKEAAALEIKLTTLKQSSQKEIDDLSKRLEQSEKEKADSAKQLMSLDKEKADLILKNIEMQNKIAALLDTEKDIKQTAADEIADLKKALQLKQQETDDLKAENDVLKTSKQEVIDSCTTVKEQYTDLQIKVEEDLKKMQDIPGLILKITNLNREIHALNKAIASKTGDETELKKELEQKLKELAQIEGALGGKSPAAKQIIEVIAILRQKGNVIADNTEEYLARITELENELDEKIDALQDKEGERIKAVLKMLEHEDEISQLKNVLAKAKADAAQKIAVIETKLNQKHIEIDRLKAEDCGKGQKVQQIQALEKEAAALEIKLTNLKQSSQKEIDDLSKRLERSEKEKADSAKQLMSLDKEKADLILKNIEMQNKIAALLDTEKGIKQTAADEIADLKKENAKLKAENHELRASVTQAKACAHLEEQNEVLKNEIAKFKAENDALRNELNAKDGALNTLQTEKDKAVDDLKKRNNELKTQQGKTKALEEEKKQLEASLRKMEAENEEQKRKIEEFESAKKEKAVQIYQPAIDPASAHPKLQLANHNTEMRLLQNPQSVPNLPQRFNHVTGTLASTGFQEGRPYWEVGVDGKRCYVLGVASETAMKKGRISFTPKNKYWTLTLQRSDVLNANDRRRIQLRGEGVDKPAKIGVMIDFNKEEISFYDVDQRAHMYTFKDVGTQAIKSSNPAKLFPFISTCEDTDVGSPPMVFRAVTSAKWLES